jgi:hypothetical protein
MPDTATSSLVIDLRDSAREAGHSDQPATIALPVRTIRTARLAAVAVLIVLNIADLVTTRMFLDRGLEEGNGLSWVLIQNGSMPWIKSAILAGLAWRALRSVPTFGATCAMWFVVGLYAMTITINCLAIASL